MAQRTHRGDGGPCSLSHDVRDAQTLCVGQCGQRCNTPQTSAHPHSANAARGGPRPPHAADIKEPAQAPRAEDSGGRNTQKRVAAQLLRGRAIPQWASPQCTLLRVCTATYC